MLDVAAGEGAYSRGHRGRAESGPFSLGPQPSSYGGGTPMTSSSMMALQGDPALLEFHTTKLPGIKVSCLNLKCSSLRVFFSPQTPRC